MTHVILDPIEPSLVLSRRQRAPVSGPRPSSLPSTLHYIWFRLGSFFASCLPVSAQRCRLVYRSPNVASPQLVSSHQHIHRFIVSPFDTMDHIHNALQQLQQQQQQSQAQAAEQFAALQQQQLAVMQQVQQQLAAIQQQAAQQAPPPPPPPPPPPAAPAAPARHEPKPPKPNMFDGMRAPSKALAQTWLAEMEQYLEVAAVPVDRWVLHAAPYLRDFAGTAYRQAAPLTSWQAFSAWFLRRFQPMAPSKTARAALKQLTQKGRSLLSYNEAFMNQLQTIDDMSEADQIANYLAGLHPRIALEVDRLEPKTLADAMEQAQKEDLRWTTHQRQRANQQQSSHGNTRSHTSFTQRNHSGAHGGGQQSVPMEIGNIESKHDDGRADGKQMHAMQQHQRVSKLTDQEREQCRKKGLCFRCRRPGHMSNACPAFPSSKSNKPNGARHSHMQQEEEQENE